MKDLKKLLDTKVRKTKTHLALKKKTTAIKLLKPKKPRLTP